MGAAALMGVGIVMVSFNPVIKQSLSPQISWLLLIASLLLLIALPGMYFKQAGAAGWLGLVGYVLLQAGVVLIALAAAPRLLYPSLLQAPGESLVLFVLGIALTLGLLLTAIATLRAGVYPRWAGILMLGAMAGFFFVFFVAEFLPPAPGQIGSAVFGLLLALSLAWIGYSLLAGKAF
jgi:hypothetical protein